MKILIVGFDGATWDLINKFELPNFKKLVENGVVATMKSTYPPVTIPAWPCMFSGYNPGKIGAVDFYRREQNNSFKLVSSRTWKGKLIWDRLKNLKFLVLNIPFTYPPYRINGDIISIDFSPLNKYTYPPELEKEIETVFDVYSIRNSEKKGLKELYEKEIAIMRIFKYLIKKNNYDVAIVRFGIPDQATHKTTCFQEIERCHYLMDELLGEVVESTDFDYLFLVSDHGVQKSKRRFCINTWLYKNGYLNLTLKGKIYLISRRFYEKIVFKKVIRNFIRKILNYRHNKRKNVPIPHIPVRVLNVINYKKSLAFGYLSNSLKQSPIYLQIDSSSPEYNNLINKISKELLLIKDDNGERVVKRVFTKNEAYSGKYMDNMPDIVVESNRCILTVPLPDVFPEINSYTHSMNGIFLASGKGIKKGEKINEVQIYDITPTILHILGLPVPEDMDGRVLTELFVPESPAGKSRPRYVKPEYYMKHVTLKNKIAKLKNKL